MTECAAMGWPAALVASVAIIGFFGFMAILVWKE
jgi:hypothetical protein